MISTFWRVSVNQLLNPYVCVCAYVCVPVCVPVCVSPTGILFYDLCMYNLLESNVWAVHVHVFCWVFWVALSNDSGKPLPSLPLGGSPPLLLFCQISLFILVSSCFLVSRSWGWVVLENVYVCTPWWHFQSSSMNESSSEITSYFYYDWMNSTATITIKGVRCRECRWRPLHFGHLRTLCAHWLCVFCCFAISAAQSHFLIRLWEWTTCATRIQPFLLQSLSDSNAQDTARHLHSSAEQNQNEAPEDLNTGHDCHLHPSAASNPGKASTSTCMALLLEQLHGWYWNSCNFYAIISTISTFDLAARPVRSLLRNKQKPFSFTPRRHA